MSEGGGDAIRYEDGWLGSIERRVEDGRVLKNGERCDELKCCLWDIFWACELREGFGIMTQLNVGLVILILFMSGIGQWLWTYGPLCAASCERIKRDFSSNGPVVPVGCILFNIYW